MNHLWLLAASAVPSPSSTERAIDPDRVSPGVLGFLAVLFLAAAMFVIWKSMNKQLTGIDFDENDTENPRYTRKKAEAAAKKAAAEGTLPAGDAPDS